MAATAETPASERSRYSATTPHHDPRRSRTDRPRSTHVGGMWLRPELRARLREKPPHPGWSTFRVLLILRG